MATKSEDIVREVLGRMADGAPAPLDVNELDMPVVDRSGASRLPSAGRRLVAAGALVAIVVIAGAILMTSRLPADGVGPVGTPTEATLAELEAALREAYGVLMDADGFEGVSKNYIGGYLAYQAWFSGRASGDLVVLEQTDLDVAESTWWLTSSTPPVTGSIILTTASVIVDEVLYRARHRDPWEVVTPPRGFPSVIVPEDDFVPWEHLLSSLSEITSQSTSDGGVLWTVRSDEPAGVHRFRIHPNGYLAEWEFETPEPIGDPYVETSGIDFWRFTLLPLDNPEPIALPDVGDPLDLTMFDLPEGFLIGHE